MINADIVALYVDCLNAALPIALTIWAANLLVSTILRAAFGGKLEFRG